MKSLRVDFVSDFKKTDTASKASTLLNNLNKNSIDIAPWSKYNYKPVTSFAIGYTDDAILIKYYVKEETIQIIYQKINDPVYRDNCVEFFIAFDNENYYNLEFNCAGTCLGGFGKTKLERKLLPELVLNKIQYDGIIRCQNVHGTEVVFWELALVIPFEVFCQHNITSIKNKICPVNFYKCGDDLPLPHYLSWTSIQSPLPNFHLAEFFGRAEFICD